MISRVEFVRFRGFDHLRANLLPHAYVVGPNSAGKSTILEALALADRCLSIARRKKPPAHAAHNGYSVRTYPLSADLNSDDDPVRYEFGSEETRVTVEWTNGARAHLVWPEDEEQGYFYLETQHGLQPQGIPAVRELYSRITAVPVVTPLDRIEELKDSIYVEAKKDTRLASRHFRNHARQMSLAGEWSGFTEYCREWLPEIQLLDVKLDAGANRLAVFYSEQGSRVPKELAWAGDGIQIWVQLLWHLFRARSAATVVLDEPEVYLHPDLQRRLVRLLDGLPAQIVLASHSADVIAEAPPGAVLWVDRRSNSARRAATQQSLSDLGASLGSAYNLALARTTRSRLVVASDCADLRIIRMLAKHVGAAAITNEQQVSLLGMQEVSNWSGSVDLGRSIREAIGVTLPVFFLLQAGFRPSAVNAQIRGNLASPGISVSILARTELENYLLDAETIARVSGAAATTITVHMAEACERLYEVTRSVFVAAWVAAARDGERTEALLEAEVAFDAMWVDLDRRMELVRGSQIINDLNVWFERDGYRSVSGYSLAKAIRPDALPTEVYYQLLSIDKLLH